MEQMRAHLARADSELEAAQRLLDPKTEDEFEMDLVRAMANARTLIGDALETIRARFWGRVLGKEQVRSVLPLASHHGGAARAGSVGRCLPDGKALAVRAASCYGA